MMTEYENRISELIIKKLNAEISEVDERELEKWMSESKSNRAIADEFLVEEKFQTGIREMYAVEDKIWDRLKDPASENVSLSPDRCSGLDYPASLCWRVFLFS